MSLEELSQSSVFPVLITTFASFRTQLKTSPTDTKIQSVISRIEVEKKQEIKEGLESFTILEHMAQQIKENQTVSEEKLKPSFDRLHAILTRACNLSRYGTTLPIQE
jgi:hypothetical protein